MRRARATGAVWAVLAVTILAACGGGGDGVCGLRSACQGPPGLTLPPANGTFDYQIGGAYEPAPGVAVVSRDRNDPPVPGKYNVCYVNAFQTQPEENGWWRANHPELLLMRNGSEVEDPGWPGELVLDVSTPAKRAAIAAIVGGWIDGCAASGFQAVEPDNLDSWTRSHDLLDEEDNVALSELLAQRAHAAGLAYAQKNTAELLPYRARIGFDFAIVEECQPYGDCDDFADAYGARWYEIEYPDNGGRQNFEDACKARGASTSIIYRDRPVAPAGAAEYVYESC